MERLERRRLLAAVDFSSAIYNALAPLDIAFGDFNGDTKPDVLTANGAPEAVSLYAGNGDGTLQTPVRLVVGGGNASSIVTADFNRDSKLDVAVTLQEHDTVGVLLGNGDGTFSGPVVRSRPASSFPGRG